MRTQIINDCLNIITFEGDKTKIEEALDFITDSNRHNTDNIGKELTLTKYGYSVSTDWEPNITGVKRIADKFDLNFRLQYDEPGNQLFGEVIYEDGELTIIELDDDDFSKVSFDEESGLYTYGSQIGCDMSEFFVDLLFAKVCSNYPA